MFYDKFFNQDLEDEKYKQQGGADNNEGNNTWIIIGVIIGICVCFTLIGLAAFFTIRSSSSKSSTRVMPYDNSTSMPQSTSRSQSVQYSQSNLPYGAQY